MKNQAWITGNSRKVEKGRTNELLDTRDCIKCCLARISREKTRRFVPPHFGWKFTASRFSLLPLIVHSPPKHVPPPPRFITVVQYHAWLLHSSWIQSHPPTSLTPPLFIYTISEVSRPLCLSLRRASAHTQTLKPSLTRSLYADWYSDHSHMPVTTHSPAAMRINAGVLNILCSTNITPRRQNLSLSRSFSLFHSHDVVSAATNFIKNSITSPVTGTVTQTEGKKRLRDRDRPSSEGK